MFRRLVWRLRPPAEIAATCSEIRTFVRLHSRESADLLELAAVEVARDAERTVRATRMQHVRPEQHALEIILEVVARYLPSGRYHAEAGVLNEVGRDLLRAGTAAVETMRTRGYLTEAQSQKTLRQLRDQAGRAG